MAGIASVPNRAKHIEEILLDLTRICKKHHIRYVVIGATAIVCGLENLYRIPYDVDVLFDIKKERLLYKDLLQKGYHISKQKHLLNQFLVKGLERFISGKKIIEPRGVYFTKKGIEFCFKLPFTDGIRNGFRITLQANKFKSVKYNFGKTSFLGWSKEALWLALDKTIKINFGSKKDYQKRFKELKLLQKSLN